MRRRIDAIGARPILPFGLQRGFIVGAFGLPAVQRGDLRRFRAAETGRRHQLLDILAALREGHDLLTAVAFQLPCPVGSGDLDAIAELLRFAGELGAINGGAEGLGAVDLDRIESAPLAIRPPGHIQQHHVRMQLRVRPMVGFAGGTRGEMIEGRTYDIGGDDALPATTLMRDGVSLRLPGGSARLLGCAPGSGGCRRRPAPER